MFLYYIVFLYCFLLFNTYILAYQFVHIVGSLICAPLGLKTTYLATVNQVQTLQTTTTMPKVLALAWAWTLSKKGPSQYVNGREIEDRPHEQSHHYKEKKKKKKRHNITSIIAMKKIIDVIYILLHLQVVFCCNSNLNLLHQYEIVATMCCCNR